LSVLRSRRNEKFVKLVLTWGIIVVMLLVAPFTLYAVQNTSAADENAQAVAYYNQLVILISNRQFEISNRLQELYFQLYEATDTDEIAELEEENNMLVNELAATVRQLETLQVRISAIEADSNDTNLNDDVYPSYDVDIYEPSEINEWDDEAEADVIPVSVGDVTADTEIEPPPQDVEAEPENIPTPQVAEVNPEVNILSVMAMILIVAAVAGIVAMFIMRKKRLVRHRAYKLVRFAVVVAVIISIGSFAMRNHADAHAARQGNWTQTFVLERSEYMRRVVSTSGVVQSSETVNIFSMQNRPVQEILVEVGDTVQEGDVLARLDMSQLEWDIAQARLNLLNASVNALEEARTNENAIANAATSLEASRIALSRQQLNTANVERDLREAEANMRESFDSSSFDRAIEDARLNVQRRTTDVQNAERDLQDALEDFDDFVFRNNVADARVRLERSMNALQEARAELHDEQNRRPDAFDAHVHQNNIDDAQRVLDRNRIDKDTALIQLHDAEWTLVMVTQSPYATPADTAAAHNAVAAARAQYDNAERLVENAEINLERARTNLTRARDEHNRRTNEGRDDLLSVLEAAADRAQDAVDDAQRAYNRANEDLERGRENASESTQNAFERAENNLTRMQDNLSDAIRAYERALLDKESAIDNFLDLNTDRLEIAQRQFADSRIQLQTAQNNVTSASNTLAQAQERPVTARTNIDIQQTNIARLEDQLAEGTIVATTGGVITAVNTSVGATPSGILFMIEDIDNLYVSANVREHSLVDLYVGQRGYVTTVATGNREFDADLTFISPRAVSPAGSTSVEFEVRAAISGISNDVRIGMNAFLNIVTDTRYNVFSIPISALVVNEYGSFVYALQDDTYREIAVTTGLRTSTHIEIYGDQLVEGLNIILRPLDARGR